jgi:ribosomal protein S27E
MRRQTECKYNHGAINWIYDAKWKSSHCKECAKLRYNPTGGKAGRPPKLAETLEFLTLRQQGLTYREIAAKYGITIGAVHKRCVYGSTQSVTNTA